MTASKTATASDLPDEEKESEKWQYANCWTTVYAKLFDRVTKSKDTEIDRNSEE